LKLASKFFRAYELVQRIGHVAYKLQLLPKARIHNVFHVAFVKKFEGAPHLPRHCHQMFAAEPCHNRRRWSTLDHRKIPRRCWSIGKATQQVKQRESP
jgi:hypothetical protein